MQRNLVGDGTWADLPFDMFAVWRHLARAQLRVAALILTRPEIREATDNWTIGKAAHIATRSGADLTLSAYEEYHSRAHALRWAIHNGHDTLSLRVRPSVMDWETSSPENIVKSAFVAYAAHVDEMHGAEPWDIDAEQWNRASTYCSEWIRLAARIASSPTALNIFKDTVRHHNQSGENRPCPTLGDFAMAITASVEGEIVDQALTRETVRSVMSREVYRAALKGDDRTIRKLSLVTKILDA